MPTLDVDEFSPDKAGKHWDFNWFDQAKVPLDPSLPRSVVVPVWELPFRRQKSKSGVWEPKSVEVDYSFSNNVSLASIFCLSNVNVVVHWGLTYSCQLTL